MKIFEQARNNSSIKKEELIKMIYQSEKRLKEIQKTFQKLKKEFPEKYNLSYFEKSRIEKVKHSITSLKKLMTISSNKALD